MKEKDDNKHKTRDRIIIIIIIIIIILLLLHSCCPGRKHGGSGDKTTTTAKVIDIEVDDKTTTISTETNDTTTTTTSEVITTSESTTDDILDTTTSNVTNSNKMTRKPTKKTTKKTTTKSTSTTTTESTTVTLDVSDSSHNSVSWNGSSNLGIFDFASSKVDGVVAPEDTGTYQFIVRNKTNYNFKYNIVFNENNDKNMNIMYKLKRNGTYLIDHYVYYNELDISNQLINKNKSDIYELEWKWVSSDNDTNVGISGGTYSLTINIAAESTNG